MESPPTCSTWSEVFPTSDDSGLLLTSGHSGSISSGSGGGQLPLEFSKLDVFQLLESDGEEKSLSQDDSLDYSDGMCGENFNTLKKGPGWPDLPGDGCKHVIPIDPPPEFQDSPPESLLKFERCLERFALRLVAAVLEEALRVSSKSVVHPESVKPDNSPKKVQVTNVQQQFRSRARLCWTPELLAFSPCHRPSSRSSLSSSRLSSSHNSLSVPAANRADDSSFITSAMSHDVLTAGDISDVYNVPFDSDIYAVPVDVVRPEVRVPPSRPKRHHRKPRRRHTSSSGVGSAKCAPGNTGCRSGKPTPPVSVCSGGGSGGGSKRHSVPGTSKRRVAEPVHMTLHEVRQYLQNLYSSSSDSSENRPIAKHRQTCNTAPSVTNTFGTVSGSTTDAADVRRNKKNNFVINIKNKKAKESCDIVQDRGNIKNENSVCEKEKQKKSSGRHSFTMSLKQTLCNIFRFRKFSSPDRSVIKREPVAQQPKPSVEPCKISNGTVNLEGKPPFLRRALPPLPAVTSNDASETNGAMDATPLPSPDDGQLINEDDDDVEIAGEELSMDFASSIEKVKDYGWYWGPISGEAAEKILSNEPDGSFIVRDSSDDHYIFSLTFKLHGCIRHVRIEHDQGNFSFGSCTKFKSHTIVDFIENAVEHSRSGRYLFFLHRRPVLGPMRVQLLHPVSRFKQVQSLQHMCRFVILKLVRRDLIHTLPLPRRVIDYLNTPHYYSEQLLEDERSSSPSADAQVELISFVPHHVS
ncbi:uncharacterized protein LOC126365850 isoform X1 [Schistocerca gregaria]|uniref:uncharacterized protein LOC126365850 isoform X1 n=1 Tax=Schistocerca gregaria TaxID=7010 RepID=UPI00211E0BC2|nr:uncharacterized protein LOC126365850 isoform X1 [Schistocerca gregaria]XP_049864461.1 uncharacterized protein LOC126365850 isoform X1 [Schistocerca gregaria]XP_049864462.1 uncharacterized protein LOC126365850 isoform X1 [Schistocerca gregaria]